MSEYIVYESEGIEVADYRGVEHHVSHFEQREPIVRCRNCKEFTFGSDEYATVDWCDYWGAYVESPDGFCAWGERETINKTGDFVTHDSGECENVWDVELTGRLRFQCSECGAVSLEITPRFCPNCGRKVVSDGTSK